MRDEIEVTRTGGSYSSMQEAMEDALELIEQRRLHDVQSVEIDSEFLLPVDDGERFQTGWKITVKGRVD